MSSGKGKVTLLDVMLSAIQRQLQQRMQGLALEKFEHGIRLIIPLTTVADYMRKSIEEMVREGRPILPLSAIDIKPCEAGVAIEVKVV
jgi:hypothetical protein